MATMSPEEIKQLIEDKSQEALSLAAEGAEDAAERVAKRICLEQIGTSQDQTMTTVAKIAHVWRDHSRDAYLARSAFHRSLAAQPPPPRSIRGGSSSADPAEAGMEETTTVMQDEWDESAWDEQTKRHLAEWRYWKTRYNSEPPSGWTPERDLPHHTTTTTHDQTDQNTTKTTIEEETEEDAATKCLEDSLNDVV